MDDFLVIGGGIAGISAAARLSALGSVVLLEAEDGLGYHASGRSAAMFEETYGSPSTVALNLASKDYLQNANGGVFSPRGLMLVGTKDVRAEFARDMVDMHMEAISFDDALSMVPILDPNVVTEVGHHVGAFDIDTDLLIQNFARELRANGGRIVLRQRVSAIRKSTQGWQVVTPDGDHQARTLINAAGPWVDEIAAMAGIAPIGILPCRRSMARIPAPDGHDVTNWPLLFGPGENWYAKPDAGRLLVSPADEDATTPHDAWPEDITLATGIAAFEAVTTHEVTRLESSWAGLRSFAPDRSLVLGPDPDDRSFVWSAGQGGYGFQTSAAASQLVADLVAERTSELDPESIRALSPERFRE